MTNPTEKKLLQHLPAVAGVFDFLDKLYSSDAIKDAKIVAKLAHAAYDKLKGMLDGPPVTGAVVEEHLKSLHDELAAHDKNADAELDAKFDHETGKP